MMCESSAPAIRGRLIALAEAVGSVLAHDITEIRPGEFKGPAFKKGHLVRESDLEHLARLGKRHLYVLEITPGLMHEDEAVLELAEALAGEGVTFNPHPSEGKINLTAARDGLFTVNVAALTEFNLVEDVMCASRHSHTVVKKGDILAGTRAIPLVIPARQVHQAAAAARQVGGVFAVKELTRVKTGLIVTGNEVYSGLIEDRFVAAVSPKLEAFGCPVIRVVLCPDEAEAIAQAVKDLIDFGAQLIVATGGMSVDPDDVTRLGVLALDPEDFLYGSAVLPGAMLLLAKVRGVTIIGVPACGIYHQTTVFDLVLPRVLAGENLTRRDIAALGHGGLCLNCPTCRFPVCPFGKAA